MSHLKKVINLSISTNFLILTIILTISPLHSIELDYQRSLFFGNQFKVGDVDQPLIPNDNVAYFTEENIENDFEVGAASKYKSMYPHFFSEGNKILTTAGTGGDSLWNRSDWDLYLFDRLTKTKINLSNDGDKAREIYYDQRNDGMKDLFLYTSIRTIEERGTNKYDITELRITDTNGNYETLATFGIYEKIENTAFLDKDGTVLIVSSTEKERYYDIIKNGKKITYTINRVEGDYYHLLDINYGSNKESDGINRALFSTGIGSVANDHALLTFDSDDNIKVQSLPATSKFNLSLLSPNGLFIAFNDAKSSNYGGISELGVYNINTHVRTNLFTTNEDEKYPEIFWLDYNFIGIMFNKKSESKTFNIFVANINGRSIVEHTYPGSYNGWQMFGHHLVSRYGRACPQVFTAHRGGKLNFIDEILKDSNNIDLRRWDKVVIPITQLDKTEPKILITDKLRERSSIHNIKLYSDAGPVEFSIDSSIKQINDTWFLDQGDSIWIDIDDIPDNANVLYLEADGFYRKW